MQASECSVRALHAQLQFTSLTASPLCATLLPFHMALHPLPHTDTLSSNNTQQLGICYISHAIFGPSTFAHTVSSFCPLSSLIRPLCTPTFSPSYTLCSLQTHSLVHIDPLSKMLPLPVCAWLTPTCLSDCSISGPSSETFPESQTNSIFPFIKSYDTWNFLSYIYLGCDKAFMPVFPDGNSILCTMSPAHSLEPVL